MRSGQFYRGKIGGIQKSFESPNLNLLLPSEKLQELADQDTAGVYPRFFRKERVLTCTVIEAADNSSDGRRGGITNHTVLYQFDRTITHETAQYIFDVETFVAEIHAGKRCFAMPPKPELPETDSDFALIADPPPITWEVEK